MAVPKKTASSKKRVARTKTRVTVAEPKQSTIQKARVRITQPVARMTRRVRGLLARRPHRSFRRTMRRDYVRSLRLPGYWALTNHVRKTLWEHKRLFMFMVLAYVAFTIGLVGIASQDIYTELGDTLRETSDQVFSGNMGEVGKASLLLITGATGMANPQLTPAQQAYATMLVLFTWLTTVWLLRAILAGRKPKLRDGLYNAGAPIIPTLLVALVLLVQLLPVALAVVAYMAAASTGLLNEGIEPMIFWSCAVLLGGLSLYWITSTLIALVVVTLPGMYPMEAIRTAGDLVIGRRVRILLRILWLMLILALTWALIMIPIILFDAWLKGIQPAVEWLPIVPAALLVMSTLTVIWSASYVYLFYRKVVDDDAAPA